MATNFFIAVILLIQWGKNCAAQANSITDTVSLQSVNKNSSNQSDSPQTTLAMFPGGPRAFSIHLMKNLRLPENNTEKMDVNIAVTFTIEPTGKLKNFIASAGSKDLQQEAIRVIKTSGEWIPAYRDTKPVSSERTQKIRFMRE